MTAKNRAAAAVHDRDRAGVSRDGRGAALAGHLPRVEHLQQPRPGILPLI